MGQNDLNRELEEEQHMRNEFNLMNDIESIWSTCVTWVDWYEQNKDEE
jgi:hypothetical protein